MSPQGGVMPKRVIIKLSIPNNKSVNHTFHHYNNPVRNPKVKCKMSDFIAYSNKKLNSSD